MDKRSIIGYLLIAATLFGYMYFNQPDPQAIEAQKHYQDSIAAIQYEQELASIKEAEPCEVSHLDRKFLGRRNCRKCIPSGNKAC